MRHAIWLMLAVGFVAAPGTARAATPLRVDVPLRGKTMSVMVYRPAGTAKGTIIMGSGDVGWV